MALSTRIPPARSGFSLGKVWSTRLADLGAYLLLTVVGVTMILPFVWMVGTSLKTLREVYSWPPSFFPAVAQWGNYAKAWRYSEMVPFARCATAGYAFARLRFPGRDKLFLFYIATLMVPFQVTLVPLYLIMKNLHWINTYQSLIVPGLVSAYGTFLMRQFMTTLPFELEDAARIDGASPPVILWRVIIPLCTPVLTTLTILAFMGSWNAFLWPLIMISNTNLRTIPIGLAFFTAVTLDQGLPAYQLMLAAATFSMIPTLIVFLAGQRYFIKGIALSGLKG
jgi:multiple sugar transport system permease protein